MKDVNKFTFSGRIKKIFTDKSGNPSITLAIIKDINRVNNITVIMSSPLPPDIIEGEHVIVKGYVRASVYIDADDSTKSSLRFISTDIKRAKTILEMECGVRGRFYRNDFSVITLVGEVTRIQAMPNTTDWVTVYVTTDVDGRKDTTALSYCTKARLPGIGKLAVEDKVAVYGSAQTQNKVVNGEKKHYENVMVEDIVTIEKAKLDIM